MFGALNEKSIAWNIASRAHEEGAEIVLTNAPVAFRMGSIRELAERLNTIAIPADATKIEIGRASCRERVCVGV